ncbi:hypothetical protein ABWH96_20545 [Marivirga tractuosa]|uniref:hypothetical protein n=1 Tax=Marivirga tractuosa TaxID=1006 RepID=UPI0035CEB486
MNQEFRTAKGWSIFIYIFTPLLIALFVFLGIMPFMADEIVWWLVLLLVPVSIGMSLFMIYGLLSTYKGRIIINSDKVVEVDVFKNKELELSNIKGYRIDQNYTYLIPKNAHLKPIKVSQFIGNKNSFNQWLYTNFVDVDVIESSQEVEQILANEEYGRTVEERENKLKQARLVARTLNGIGSLLAVLLFFYPRPYELITLIALIFPVFILASLHFFRGLIRIDQKNNSGYPSTIYGFILPGMALALRSFIDFNILEYSNFWLPAFAVTIATSLIMFSTTSELKFKKAIDYVTAIFIVVFVFVYSYGGIINYNCIYDESEPKVYSSEVLHMRISTGKSTSYYLELKAWGPVAETEDVSISKSLYDRIEVGESVNIYLMKGKINIPWFTITEQ